jgi:serine/threonine protein kinase
MSSKGKAKTDSEDAEENPDSPAAQSKENDDPNSMKQLQLELNEIAKDKYEIKSYLGRGSYGVVVAAEDTGNSEKVAIKRIYPDVLRNPFLGTRVVREIKLLSHFNHPNIIGIRNLFCTVRQGKESVWMVMDVMDMDLQALMRSGQALSEQHVQFFMAQILSALECIHDAGVIHRDLTPANCLLDINCDLRICDFGLAREEDNFMTDYVVMRWYRAPELLMQLPTYNTSVDIWAAGCILAQMLHDGKPLFKGTSTLHQFEAIIDIIGTPSEEVINALDASPVAKAACRKRGRIAPTEFSKILKLPDGTPIGTKCCEFLQKLLAFHPKDRPAARQAQRHPYMARVGYRVDCKSSPFCFPLTHEFEIDEVMDQLKQIMSAKGWGNFEQPLERLCSSNLSSISLSLHRPTSHFDSRTALMGSSRSINTRKPNASRPTTEVVEVHPTAEGGDLAAVNVPDPGGEGDREVFRGIPTLQDRLAK